MFELIIVHLIQLNWIEFLFDMLLFGILHFENADHDCTNFDWR